MLEYLPYITVIVNAIFTGAGVAIGTWLSNKVILNHLDKIEKKLKIRRRKNGYI